MLSQKMLYFQCMMGSWKKMFVYIHTYNILIKMVLQVLCCNISLAGSLLLLELEENKRNMKTKVTQVIKQACCLY